MHAHARWHSVCVCVYKHISVRAVPQAVGMGVHTPAWVHAPPFAQVLEEPHVCTGTCTLTQPWADVLTHMYGHVHTRHTSANASTHTRVCSRTPTHICTSTCISVHILKQACISHTQAFACVHRHVCTCTCMCAQTCLHLHLHVCTDMHTRRSRTYTLTHAQMHAYCPNICIPPHALALAHMCTRTLQAHSAPCCVPTTLSHPQGPRVRWAGRCWCRCVQQDVSSIAIAASQWQLRCVALQSAAVGLQHGEPWDPEGSAGCRG